MPGRLSVLVRASRPPVIVRFSLLYRDSKSFAYSLPSSRSTGIGPGSAGVEVFLARRVGGMFSRRVVYALKTPRGMQVQLALPLRWTSVDSGEVYCFPEDGREGNKQGHYRLSFHVNRL